MKKKAFLVLAAVLTIIMAVPAFTKAQSELAITGSEASVEFPARLSFSLAAEGPAQITDVRLHYQVERLSFVPVTSEVYVPVVPDTSVRADWALEMIRIGGLPPGSVIHYWWTVSDAAGKTVATAPASVQFDDNRYQWQSLSQGMVGLYWYSGDQAFAEELMTLAQEALAKLKASTGAELDTSIKLYIYGSSDDLRGAMIFPQEWTGGVAYTRYGILTIGIAPDELDWGRRAIVHELTHLVVHQETLNPYSDIPTWLDEGLAMSSEGPLEAIFSGYLNTAIAQDTLISVPSLASPFSVFSDQAALSYAESYTLVDFLITTYGEDKMSALLGAFRAGNTYDGALKAVYGFDMEGLDALWRAWIMEPAPVPAPTVSLLEAEPLTAGAY